MRPELIQDCACLKPSPSCPMRFVTGTRTLSNTISHGLSSTMRSYDAATFKPGVSMSTRKPVMPPRALSPNP
jgi:hypothetical protein